MRITGLFVFEQGAQVPVGVKGHLNDSEASLGRNVFHARVPCCFVLPFFCEDAIKQAKTNISKARRKSLEGLFHLRFGVERRINLNAHPTTFPPKGLAQPLCHEVSKRSLFKRFHSEVAIVSKRCGCRNCHGGG